MKKKLTLTYPKLYSIYGKYQLRYNKNCNSGQICLMWSTIKPPDTLTETKQIVDIEKAFEIQLDEDKAVALYDMRLKEAVPFIEKKMKEQILR